MRYGVSTSSGHGHRPCSYAWKPTIYRPMQFRRPKSTQRHWHPAPQPSQSLFQAFYKHLFHSFSDAPRVPLGYQTYLAFGDALFRLGLDTLAFVFIGGLLAVIDLFITKQSEKTDRRINIQRKTSVNPPPTPEAILAAWETVRSTKRNDPEALAARLRLGSMLADLEPAVDQSYIRDEDGTIVGRRPGLKGWIGLHCPTLVPHYKALMSYKALAAKLCEALHINEPDTIDSVLCMEGKQPTKILVMRETMRVEASNTEEVRKAFQELFGEGMPRTMAALEERVRLTLGKVWMQRRRKRRSAA